MRRFILATAVASVLAMPAGARVRHSEDAEAARVAERLNEPRMQDAMAGTVAAMFDALLDVRVDRLRAAMAKMDPDARGDAPGQGYRDKGPQTLRDMMVRDDPDFERNFARDTRRATAQLGAAASGMAEMLPEFRAMGERMGKQLEKAMRRFPADSY